MSRKQIQKDYLNVDYVDAKGNVKTNVVYNGKLYYPMDNNNLSKLKISYLVLSILSTIMFVLALALDSVSSRTIYFVMPFIFQVFPLGYLIYVTYTLLAKKPPYRQEVYNTCFVNSRGFCVGGIVCSAAAIIGFIICAIMNSLTANDAAQGVACGVCLITFMYLLGITAKFEISDIAK